MYEHTVPAPAIAGYRLEEVVGRGGMGEVHRAVDERLGRPVAVKILTGDAAADPELRRRLLEESRAAAALDHPNVIPVYEADEADGHAFIAMRYVAGGDLRGLLRSEGRLAPERAIAICRQVADALDAAHRRGLVHRDVKPGNVLIDTEDGREHAYLADFGLTRPPHDGPADGRLMGTLAYVAPEQIRGDEVNGRADQYALACLLFECVTGGVPFRGGSDVAALFAHLETPPPAASERGAGLPRELDAVLERGMAKDPTARFASCTELIDAAADALGVGRPARARRRRPLLAAVALAAVAAAVAVLASWGGGGGAPAAQPPPGALVRIDPRTNAVAGRTPVAGRPGAVEVTPGGIWMADFQGGALWRFQPGAQSAERLTSDGEPRDLAVAGNQVYVGADGAGLTGTVTRYDAVSGARQDDVDLLACALASGDGVVWAAGCPYVQRLSTGRGKLRIVRQRFLPFRAPATVSNGRVQFRELAVGGGSLWVLGDALDRRLWRLDDHTGKVLATVPLPFPPRSVAWADGAAWITDSVGDAAVPVGAHGRVGEPVRVGRSPDGIRAGAGALWVANTLDGTVSRIDPRARRVVATIRVGGLPRRVAIGGGAVWVTEHAP